MIKFLKQFILRFLNKKNKVDKYGKRHGYWECYHANSKLYYKGYYIHGERHGLWEEYYYTGQLHYKGNYIHKDLCGYCEIYWSNGQLRNKGLYYKNNEIHATKKNKLIL